MPVHLVVRRTNRSCKMTTISEVKTMENEKKTVNVKNMVGIGTAVCGTICGVIGIVKFSRARRMPRS